MAGFFSVVQQSIRAPRRGGKSKLRVRAPIQSLPHYGDYGYLVDIAKTFRIARMSAP
jgi:hypothetical protein